MEHGQDTSVVDVDAYLDRLGVDPNTVDTDVETLARLQHAHVRNVPFENLTIVGDPFDDRAGDGVHLDTTHLFEKVVDGDRGGYCFELNGLFHALLDQLGFDVDRVAARVVSGGGNATPANHHSNIVHLDDPVVVDVGMGTPQMRRPTPLDGTAVTGDAGVTWRVSESTDHAEAYRTEYREPEDAEWSTRYVFDTTPRPLHYFAATNDYLQTSPESPFTGGPVVSIATADGYRKLSLDSLSEVAFRDREGTTEKITRERAVATDDWHDVLADAFGTAIDD